MKYVFGAVAGLLGVSSAHAATLEVSSLPIVSHIVHGVTITPEPATWAFMIIGFAALALRVGARRKVSA